MPADVYQRPTLSFLLEQLRADLDDVLVGDNAYGYFNRTELVGWINRAKAETEVQTRCHRLRVSVPLVAGTHTYEAPAIFEVLEVDLNGRDLAFREMAQAAVGRRGWDITPPGLPTAWMPLTGSSFRVNPTPEYNGAGIVTAVTVGELGSGYLLGDLLAIDDGDGGAQVRVTRLDAGPEHGVAEVEVFLEVDADGQPVYHRGSGYRVTTRPTIALTGSGIGCTVEVLATAEPMYVHGYGTSAALVNDADAVTSIPQGYATPAILARAKALAIGAKVRLPGAAALMQAFDAVWGGFGMVGQGGQPVLTGWCAQIARSAKGGRS